MVDEGTASMPGADAFGGSGADLVTDLAAPMNVAVDGVTDSVLDLAIEIAKEVERDVASARSVITEPSWGSAAA